MPFCLYFGRTSPVAKRIGDKPSQELCNLQYCMPSVELEAGVLSLLRGWKLITTSPGEFGQTHLACVSESRFIVAFLTFSFSLGVLLSCLGSGSNPEALE